MTKPIQNLLQGARHVADTYPTAASSQPISERSSLFVNSLRMPSAIRTTQEQTTLTSKIIPTSSPTRTLELKALTGLAKRVRGFSVKEVKMTYEQDGMGNRTLKNEIVTRKQIPPDLAAIIFTLTNLNGEFWKNKSSGENAGDEVASGQGDPNDELDLSRLSEQALREITGLMK